MQTIISMYVTLMPVIFAGIANMAFCKAAFLDAAYYPMDNYITLADGKRLFGDNKTWKGFFGMVFFGAVFQVLWGMILSELSFLEGAHYIYQTQPNTLQLNLQIGGLLGLAYVLCELPNSFVKRRLDIEPGKPAKNRFRHIFIFIDQADSIIGCVLVVMIYQRLTFGQFVLYIILGAMTHIIVNRLLYIAKLRKNPY